MSGILKAGQLVSTPSGVGRVSKILPDGRIAVEFRHTRWFRPDELRPVREKDGDGPLELKPVRVSRLGPIARYRGPE